MKARFIPSQKAFDHKGILLSTNGVIGGGDRTIPVNALDFVKAGETVKVPISYDFGAIYLGFATCYIKKGDLYADLEGRGEIYGYPCIAGFRHSDSSFTLTEVSMVAVPGDDNLKPIEEQIKHLK